MVVTNFLASVLPLAAILWIRQADYKPPIVPRDKWDSEYDYIVVGGGSAGAVVAARLSENPSWKVLLLEAGGSESILSDIPLAAATLQMTPIDWSYITEPQEASCFGLFNRQSRWPRGRVLGGSSVLNYMLYVRGNKRDYDQWHDDGNYGWSWREVLPYFIKSEDNKDKDIVDNGHHGTGGPLSVMTPPDVTPVALAFPEAGKEMGYPNVDINGPIQCGFTVPQGTLRNGARCSSSKAFLQPAKARQNLHVITFAYVTRILFDDSKRAVGVKFDRFSLTHTVTARREIIVSGGAINSPQLLMLSGIGPKAHLESLGIPVIADLPVGHNLQDHIYAGGVHFKVDQKVTLVQRRVVNLQNIIAYFTRGRGPLTALGGVEGLGFVKTKYANASDDYPDVEIHMISGGPSSDDGQTFRRVQGFTREMWEKVYKPYLQYDSFSFFPVLLRPKSRGYVKLRSTNPYDPPRINPRYLTHDDDIKVVVDAMKVAIAIGHSPALKRLGAQLFSTRFPGCEGYSQWSDPYLACMARTYTSTIYHPVGTCKMGPESDPTSVVDPYFRVLGGVKGLRVVDGSAMPRIVSGNTNAPIIMMGERASDFIKGTILPPLRQIPPPHESIPLTGGVTNRPFVESVMNHLITNAHSESNFTANNFI